MFIRKFLKKILGENLTKDNERYATYNLAIILVSFCAFFSLLFFLPETIPVLHQGSKAIYVPSIIGVFRPPAEIIIMELTFAVQKRINKFNTFLLGIIAIGSFAYYVSLI